MNSVTLSAYAKINLHLDITARLENGYHCVNNVMQSVSLFDTVTLKRTDGEDIRLTCDLPSLPCDSSNLAYRAASAYMAYTKKPMGVAIEITKRIPMQAGLAGGSTDAAAVLRGMNQLAEHPLSVDELCAIGATLGADVPFCVVGGTCFADGIGECLHPFPTMPDCFIVLSCEGEGVSTPWAFACLDRRYDGYSDGMYTPVPLDGLREALKNGDPIGVAKHLFNAFEEVILPERPMAKRLKSLLLNAGAMGAMMSGSGPSVFGIFLCEQDAHRACEFLAKQGIRAYAIRPVSSLLP